MVRSEPLEESVQNLGLSLGSSGSRGPVVQGTMRPNLCLVHGGGHAVGDTVTVKGKGLARITLYAKRMKLRVEYESGGADEITASAIEASLSKAPALDLTDVLVDAQAKAAEPADAELEAMLAELPPDVRATLPDMSQGFTAPSADQLEVLPRPDDAAKVCDGSERFWALVTKVEGERVEGLVTNVLLGGQGWAVGRRVAFEKRHIYQIEAFVAGPPGDSSVQNARALIASDGSSAAAAAARKHFSAQVPEEFAELVEKTKGMKIGDVGTPTAGPHLVAEFFRTEGAKNPGILEGTGLTADDIGVFRMQSLAACHGKKFIHDNLCNMVLAPK
eukprot:CAMPEP_0119278144 /NCGR_PEP_ID=MMETSP1329-20130426/18563_1 /TAXON_ID=114041 /ORGANISM="Genus nov. species nov., Strain RCC1024" /LENGTH=331 /DNA_ID=CAMNT_0007278647 /DNA_START=87 /DNA_END=1079 /DNA_ORIENTATION=-